MGLDSVEFVLALEDSFGIEIPNASAELMSTPRDVINYLVGALPRADTGPCLSQHAFYKLRTALRSQSGIARAAITPDSELDAFVPRQGRSAAWESVRTYLGVRKLPGPPAESDWLGRLSWWRPRRPRQVVRHMVAYSPRSFLANDGWTPSQISQVVVALCEEEFGISMRDFTLDSEFARDMGVD